MGRERVRFLLALACGIAVAACSQATQASQPRYRVTGLIRASCYQAAPPSVGQGFCTLHAQIQNEGAPGPGGTAELILKYRPKDSDQVVTATCDSVFPALDTKDVAEVDCSVVGNPLIYSTRIVGTDITFPPLAARSPV